MATLANTISKNQKRTTRDAYGNLIEAPTTQQLAGQAGLSSSPTTPSGVGLLGGTPDQQKMAGTPAQKAPALAQATGGAQRLDEAQRRGVAGVGAVSDETKQKAQQLGGLSNIEGRVQTLINSYLPGGGQAVEAAAPTVQAASITSVPADKQPAVAGELQQYVNVLAGRPWTGLSQSEQQEALLHLNNASTQAGFAIAPEQVPGMFAEAQKTIGSAVAKTTQDASAVTVGNLIAKGGLPYKAEDLASLLGVSADQLQNFSLQQLEDAVKAEQQKEFSRVQELQRTSTSQTASSAERALARQQLQEAGTSGLRTMESQVSSILDQVHNGDQVQVGGKSYTVEQLLSDKTIENMVNDYLTDPNSADSQALINSSPQFVDFINRNKAALEQAVKGVQAGATEYGNIQAQRQGELATGSGLQLPDVLQKVLFPNGMQAGLGAEKLNLSKQAANPDLFNALKTPEAATALSQFRSLANSEPAMVADLAKFSPTELQQMGFWDNSSKWQNYMKWRDTRSKLTALDPKTSADEIARTYFGVPVKYNELQKEFDQDVLYEKLGLIPDAGGKWHGLYKNGKILPADQLKAAALSGMGDFQLKDLVSRTPTFAGTTAKPKLSDPALQQQQTYKLLSPYIADGKIDAKETAALVKNMSDADIMNIHLSPKFASLEKQLEAATEGRRFATMITAIPEFKKNFTDTAGVVKSIESATKNYGASENALNADKGKLDSLTSLKNKYNSDDFNKTIDPVINSLKAQINKYSTDLMTAPAKRLAAEQVSKAAEEKAKKDQAAAKAAQDAAAAKKAAEEKAAFEKQAIDKERIAALYDDKNGWVGGGRGGGTQTNPSKKMTYEQLVAWEKTQKAGGPGKTGR